METLFGIGWQYECYWRWRVMNMCLTPYYDNWGTESGVESVKTNAKKKDKFWLIVSSFNALITFPTLRTFDWNVILVSKNSSDVTSIRVRGTWVLKARLIEKKYPSFLLMPNFRKLQDNSKNVSLKIGSRVPQKLGHFFSWEKHFSVDKSGFWGHISH